MVKYQGNKRKYAGKICNIIGYNHGRDFTLADYCCGSGEISAYWAKPTVMVDSGPWGLFWHFMGLGHFDKKLEFLDEEHYEMSCFKFVQRRVPEIPKDFCIQFLALQREAFQGKPVDIVSCHWKHPGWDGKFSLKAFEKSWRLACRLKPLRVYYEDVNRLKLDVPVIYMDPDYPDTTGYNGRTVNVQKVLSNHPASHIYVSSHVVLPGKWDEIFDVTIEGSGREDRGSSLSDRELLLYRKPTCNLTS